jgi:hypothetical protein
MSNNICNECNNNPGGYFTQFDKRLCKDCLKLNKYIIYKRLEIKKRYLLDDNEISSLPLLYKNSGWGLARYATRHDLIIYLCNKYDIPNTEEYILNIKNIDDYITGVKKEISIKNTYYDAI